MQIDLGGISVYVMAILSLAAGFLLRPATALALLVPTHVAFVISILSFQQDPDRLSANLVNGTFVLVLAFVLSQLFFRAKLIEFRNRKTIEELNTNLEEQVKIRSEQLVASEKLAFLGQHTAEIVHNLNNPLTAVTVYADLLAMDGAGDERIDELKRATEMLEETVKTILEPARRDAVRTREPVDINEVIREELRLMASRSFFKHEVETETNLRPLPPINGVWAHFSQSLGNLIKNGVDAMHSVEDRRLTIETDAADGVISIAISDTGCGISEADREKVFDPFFTTKPTISSDASPTGTGLGLPSAKKMLESYGGEIAIESAPGQGTTFRITLPTDD
jgi:signal transduction histidine kinase